MNAERLKELLEDYVLNKLDKKGIQELSQLLEDPMGKEFFEQILLVQLKNGEFETEEDMQLVYQRLEARLDAYIHQHNTPVVVLPVKWSNYRKILSIAAIFLLVFAGSTLLFLFFETRKKSLETVKLTKYNGDIAPGHNGALLHLSDGRTILLDSAADGKVAIQGKVSVVKENGTVKYLGNAESVVYNDISTNRGRQWKLVLPDGSKVWLNAASSIHYPLTFTGKERKVVVTGEVYFEIKHNALMPFKVYINSETGEGGIIEDIGTSFNVNAYRDEVTIKTTLVEGAVRVRTAATAVTIKPGEQVSAKGGGLQINTVDITAVTAWRNGLFSYHHADLPTIMREIARWYDVEVVYSEKLLKNKTFTGEIGRDLTLVQVMQGLKKMKIHFKIEEDKRIVILP
jgi:hypothetical protein